MTTNAASPSPSLVLEELRFACRKMIAAELVDDLRGGLHDVRMIHDFVTRDYVVEIRSKFYGQMAEHVIDHGPATWWDHFKQDALPTFRRWFGWEVKRKIEVLKAATVYPDLPQLPGGRFYYHEVRKLNLNLNTEE